MLERLGSLSLGVNENRRKEGMVREIGRRIEGFLVL
jgi:hypothetical protein